MSIFGQSAAEKEEFKIIERLLEIIEKLTDCHRPPHDKLILQTRFITTKNNIQMASINSITLTDNQPHTGLITVVDGAGNAYTGTLANVVVTTADPTQDTATVDPTTPNTIDVQEANPTGGTSVSVTADFTSQGNSAPAAGSTAQAIPDGTVFPGLVVPGGVTVINKVNASLKLQVAF